MSFFLFTLVLGIIMSWGKPNLAAWGLNLQYLDQNGRPLVPRELLGNSTLCYIFFWISTVFTFLLGFEVFKSRKWSLLTTIIIYCIPVLPGLAFFDVVNIPLLAWMMIGFYVMVKFIKHPSYPGIFLLAILHSLAMISHPIAIMIPIATIGIFILNFLTRNLSKKEIWKVGLYILSLIILWAIVRFGLNYPLFMQHRDFLPSLWVRPWTSKIEWLMICLPPLWMVYFLFAIVALNIVYFSNYFGFLKEKWIYTYLFVLLILFMVANYFMPVNVLMLQERFVFALPSIIIIGVGGCYEFSLWVRRRWGEKIYFIFKYAFLIVFSLQCMWVVAAIIWLHPEYYLYRNWPLFFVK